MQKFTIFIFFVLILVFFLKKIKIFFIKFLKIFHFFLNQQHLNEEEDLYVFEAYLQSIWTSFPDFYPYFLERHTPQIALKPSSLNTVFKKFANLEKFSENPNNYYDYNSLVDDIIHISPPYNYDRYENASPSPFFEGHHVLGNQPFLNKMEKNTIFNNLPNELPKLDREQSQNPNENTNFALIPPRLMKKESAFPELFRGESFFQENFLNRNDSFGLENLSMQFGLIRNSSINSEFEGNAMKMEENNNNIPYNKHLLNLPPLIGMNSEMEQKNNGDFDLNLNESKRRRSNKEGFKFTKNGGNNNNNGNGLGGLKNNQQPD